VVGYVDYLFFNTKKGTREMNIPDITPHLIYPDDPEYVAKATKYWNALHEDWAKTVQEIQAKVVGKELFGKYGITTKWDGITTYHETTEPIGKAQEK